MGGDLQLGVKSYFEEDVTKRGVHQAPHRGMALSGVRNQESKDQESLPISPA